MAAGSGNLPSTGFVFAHTFNYKYVHELPLLPLCYSQEDKFGNSHVGYGTKTESCSCLTTIVYFLLSTLRNKQQNYRRECCDFFFFFCIIFRASICWCLSLHTQPKASGLTPTSSVPAPCPASACHRQLLGAQCRFSSCPFHPGFPHSELPVTAQLLLRLCKLTPRLAPLGVSGRVLRARSYTAHPYTLPAT